MKGQANRHQRKVSDENVRYILKAHPMNRPADLAREFGVGEQTVRDIRANRLYRDVSPEIERVPCWSRYGGCSACRHFEDKGRSKSSCGFGFPEFAECSTQAGLTCNWFQPR